MVYNYQVCLGKREVLQRQYSNQRINLTHFSIAEFVSITFYTNSAIEKCTGYAKR